MKDYETKQLKRLMLLLRETSIFNSHPNNVAQTYLVEESGEFLTVGSDCFYNHYKQLYYKIIDEGTKIEVLNKKNYILSYGISLTNVILLLEKKKCEVVNIIRSVDKNNFFYDHYKIFFTLEGVIKNTHCFYFKEHRDLLTFATSELGYFLCDLYQISDIKEDKKIVNGETTN